MKRKVKKRILEWRDGLHILGTPLWCDARHTREVCFVSSARVPGARRHRQVLASATTLALLPEATGRSPHSTLAVPFGKHFTLGGLRLQLLPSGFMPGSACLSVDVAGVRLLYAGVVNPKGTGLGGSLEARPADVLVVDASFAGTGHRFPPAAEVLAEAKAWAKKVAEGGGIPILLSEPLGAALELLKILDLPVVAHRTIVTAAKRLASVGVSLPAPRRHAGTPPAGSAVLWPVSARDLLPPLRRARLALVDPRARAAPFSAALDAAFPFSDHPDAEALATYIAQVGASEIHVTNASAETAKALGAQPLGQLGLFS